MSFTNNNSRNVANLLRFELLEPIKPVNQRINNIQPPSRERQEVPIQDIFTPDDNFNDKRNSRRIAPLSSQGINRGE